jgi:hypothetical protein
MAEQVILLRYFGKRKSIFPPYAVQEQVCKTGEKRAAKLVKNGLQNKKKTPRHHMS